MRLIVEGRGPASSRRTFILGSSVRRLAKTQPAGPDPTMIKSYVGRRSRMAGKERYHRLFKKYFYNVFRKRITYSTLVLGNFLAIYPEHRLLCRL